MRNIRATLEDIEATVQMCISPDEGDIYRVAVLLFSASVYGTDPRRLAVFTGYPLDFVAEVGARLNEAHIWIGDGVSTDCRWHSEYVFADTDLIVDALVGLGVAERFWCRHREAWAYRAPEHSVN